MSEGTTYRCLEHSFSVRAQRPEDGTALAAALAPFACDTGQAGCTAYELRTTGPHQFSLFVDGVQVRFSTDPAEPFDLLLWYVGERTVLSEHHRLLVHAGAVLAADGRALLLPGASGSGKSTTTYGLLAAGFPYLSDEFAIIDPAAATVTPFPRPIAVKHGSRVVLPNVDAVAVQAPADPKVTVHVPAERLGPVAEDRPHDVGWVVFPQYRPGAATELARLSPGETCRELVRSTFRADERPGQALETMAMIAAGAAGYRLTIGGLDEAVALLTGLTEGALAPS